MLLASAGTSLCGNIATQECVTSGQRDPILNMPPYAVAIFAEDVCMIPSKPTECFTQLKVSESLSNQSSAEFMMSFTELMVTTADSTYTLLVPMRCRHFTFLPSSVSNTSCCRAQYEWYATIHLSGKLLQLVSIFKKASRGDLHLTH